MAASIARDVAEEGVYVAGSVGPLGVRIEPWDQLRLKKQEKLLIANECPFGWWSRSYYLGNIW